MRGKYIFYLFSWMLLTAGNLAGQRPVFRNYTVNDGLASTECYCVHQDAAGYIWFGTDAGVCRFNGYNFQTFTTENGLPDNTIFGIQEDSKGRLWFRSYSGSLSYRQNDSIYTIQANKKIRELLGSFIVESIYVDAHDTIWLGMQSGGKCLKIAPPWQEKNVAVVPLPFTSGYFVLQPDENSVITGVSDSKISYVAAARVSPEIYVFRKNKTPFRMGLSMRGQPLCAHVHGQDLYFSFYSRIIHMNNGIVRDSISCPDYICTLMKDEKGDLWAGTKWHGVWRYKNGKQDATAEHWLDSLSISGMCVDREGGYWFSSLEKGVFYMAAGNVRQYHLSSAKKDKSYTIATDAHGKVLAGTIDAKLFEVKPDSTILLTFFPNSETKQENFLNDIQPLKNGDLIVTGNMSYYFGANGAKRFIGATDASGISNSFFRDVSVINDSEAYFLNNFIVYRLNYHSGKTILVKRLQSRAITITPGKNGSHWLGCMDGLWELRDTTLTYHGNENPFLRFRIDDLAIDKNGTVWMCTKSGGLIIRSSSGVTRLTAADGLVSNVCKTIYNDGDSLIWVGTNNGISCVSNKNGKWFIRNFSTRNGLPTNEINSITRSGDYIWAASNQGIISFNVREASVNKTPPPVYITGVSVNGKKHSTPHLELLHDENYLEINFVGLTYKDPGKTRYRYRLVGLDTNWKYTTATSVQFTTLPPGDYAFYVFAQNNDGVESLTPAMVSFSISPPFWKRWWFVSLLVLTISALIFFLIRFRVQQARRSESFVHRLARMEMKALRAQMNPHFMFNAINSIQHFILKENTDEAHKYLSKFAKLIRNVLDNSKHELISLDRDLETLTIYIELEALRFSFGFSYSIEIDPSIDRRNTGIPPMLIQPFVENAIWHGLLHKNGPGHLLIRVTKENDMLCIEIDDDGIGREKAEAIQTRRVKSHQSMGVHVTQERLELLAQVHKVPVQINIIDKTENNLPSGTRVVVTIPVLSLI